MDIKRELKTTAENEAMIWGMLVAPVTFKVDINTNGLVNVTTIPKPAIRNDGHFIFEYCLKDTAEACSVGREIPHQDLSLKVMIDANRQVSVE